MSRSFTAWVFLLSLVIGSLANASGTVRSAKVIDQDTGASASFEFQCEGENGLVMGSPDTSNERMLLPRAKAVANKECKKEHTANMKVVNDGILQLIKPSESSQNCLSASQIKAKVWGVMQEAAQIRKQAEEDREESLHIDKPEASLPAFKKIISDNYKNTIKEARAKEAEAKSLERRLKIQSGDCAIASGSKRGRPDQVGGASSGAAAESSGSAGAAK